MARSKSRERNRLKSAPLKGRSLLPKRFKRPSHPEQAKEWLNDVADHLSNFPNAMPQYRFIAYAIKKTLRNDKPETLARELGLIYPPGRSRTFEERKIEMDTARKIDALRRTGKTWPQIEEALGMDKRTLERIHQRHEDRYRKEERLAPLDRAVREGLREGR